MTTISNPVPTQDYREYLAIKTQFKTGNGFNPNWLPEWLFDFQGDLTERAICAGSYAIFADCGLGKGPMELVWAENVVRHTGRPVLILAPLAVSHQLLREAAKFGIVAVRNIDGIARPGINVTNYERLQLFNPADFAGVVCDESGILKSFQGHIRRKVTVFMRQIQYRLCATATPAPNDFIELGTTSEALGYLGYVDIINRFFKQVDASFYRRGQMGDKAITEGSKYRLKGHAEVGFWKYICSFSRAIRRPSDIGYSDARFILPGLTESQHLVDISKPPDGCLFTMPAVGLDEQRDERRRTIRERCERVAELVNSTGQQAFIGCHLDDEGDLLEKLIPDAVQVSGRNKDDVKEARLVAFAEGKERVLITKDRIGGWGLNLQNCNHVLRFPSHSYEAYYQFVRRCWRFGQTLPVHVDMVTTEGDKNVLENLQRKAAQADRMFDNLVSAMNEAHSIDRSISFSQEAKLPLWIA